MNPQTTIDSLEQMPAPAAQAPTETSDTAPISERRAEIEAKQDRIGALLADANVEGLLLLEPSNIAWLCGAALCQGIADPNEWPAVYMTPTQRWLIAGNADSQRLFDVYLDTLGFQLKEWQWHVGRDQLLGDLCTNKRLASDRLMPDCVPLGPALRRLRCLLTDSERSRLRGLGAAVSHAVEAVGRSMVAGKTEEEYAGELSHRLLRHGIVPVAITVAGDGRARRHRRPGFTSAEVQQNCLIAVIATRAGLHVATSRTVSLGPKDARLRDEYNAACRILAAQAATSSSGIPLDTALQAGRRAAATAGFEHAWRDLAPGYLTGWQPVERNFGIANSLVLEAGWPIVWQVAVGEAQCIDTYLLADTVLTVTTAIENWPMKRILVQGLSIEVPDILVRD